MKIYDNDLSNSAAIGSSQTQESYQVARQRTGAGATGSTQKGDRVEFSSALNQLAQAVSEYRQARASRVQALAAKYRSGGYRPDSRAISRAMISEALAGARQ